MVILAQEPTRARALAYQARLSAVDWRRVLLSLLLFLPWLLGRSAAFLVVAGSWCAAAVREGYDSGMKTPAPPQRPSDG